MTFVAQDAYSESEKYLNVSLSYIYILYLIIQQEKKYDRRGSKLTSVYNRKVSRGRERPIYIYMRVIVVLLSI